jgi:hypothetical protein
MLSKYNSFYPCKTLYDKLTHMCTTEPATEEEHKLCETLKENFEKCMKRQEHLKKTKDSCSTFLHFKS